MASKMPMMEITTISSVSVNLHFPFMSASHCIVQVSLSGGQPILPAGGTSRSQRAFYPGNHVGQAFEPDVRLESLTYVTFLLAGVIRPPVPDHACQSQDREVPPTGGCVDRDREVPPAGSPLV